MVTAALLGKAFSIQAEHPDCILKSRRMEGAKQLKNLTKPFQAVLLFYREMHLCFYYLLVCILVLLAARLLVLIRKHLFVLNLLNLQMIRGMSLRNAYSLVFHTL